MNDSKDAALQAVAAHPANLRAKELLERDFDELPAAKNGRRPQLRGSDVENLAAVDTGRQTLSHTRISVFLGCHRRFELKYVRRLEPVVKARALTLGSAYQKSIEYQDPEVGVKLLNGFELCEKCGGCGVIVTTLNGSALTGEPRNLLESGEVGVDICPCGDGWTGEQINFYTQEAENQHRVNEAIVRAASKLYLQVYPSPPEGSIREFEYKVRLRSPWTGAYSNSYDLLGYADELIDTAHDLPPDARADAPLELVENKLVGRVETAQVLTLPLNRQLALERYAIWRATGRTVNRVWFRWMKKPSIKQRGGRKADKSDAESLDQFLERIAEDYATRPEFYLVQEDPSFTTTKDLLRIEADLWEWAEDVRARMRNGSDGRARAFDRNTSRCSEYGGCEFIPVCTGDPDAAALYKVREKRTTISHESAPEAE